MDTRKSLELKIEDLEERIAPGLPVLTTPGGNTVVGPAAALEGASTAVAAITGAGVDTPLDFAVVC